MAVGNNTSGRMAPLCTHFRRTCVEDSLYVTESSKLGAFAIISEAVLHHHHFIHSLSLATPASSYARLSELAHSTHPHKRVPLLPGKSLAR
ncbi:hypothetical protein DL93DRAFT_2092161 [Clavulina sp. PMI_390]|nr:hypothetical protein DL93DRAFT_2092277 [Clavulina sp. PMI_390]KAF8289109.1 hypothetical protein DL93DRAFT_2092161 [Clavulina sp. PMI_390]